MNQGKFRVIQASTPKGGIAVTTRNCAAPLVRVAVARLPPPAP